MVQRDSDGGNRDDGLVEVAPPRPGGRKVTVPAVQGRFLNFGEPGEMVEGYLIGQVTEKNPQGEQRSRWRFLLLAGERQVTLPDHAHLNQLLQMVWDATGFGARLVIGYKGREKTTGISSPMARYAVYEYPTKDGEKTWVQEVIARDPAGNVSS